MLREFCIDEAMKDGFLNVKTSDAKNAALSPPAATTRLAFFDGILVGCIDQRSASLRTLSLRAAMGFGMSRLERQLSDHLSGLKLLTVIDVEGARRLTTIPAEISIMIHLWYLQWTVHSHHGVKGLPSLRNRHHLQTLDTNATVRTNDGIESLANLRCLIHVKVGRLVARQLLKLTQLMRLKITLTEAVPFNLFEKQRVVESLTLRYEEGLVPREAITIFPALRKLKLCGKISEQHHHQLPPSASFPQGLTKLVLSDSCLHRDPMPTLEKLPNLMVLLLDHRSYEGKVMSCSPSGFPRLRELALRRLEKLEVWKVEKGAMQSLTNLAIEGCRKLKMLPEELKHVTTLKEVKLAHMGSAIKQSFQQFPSINFIVE